MARWEPGTAERLQNAALELFSELGYEATTVAQIAARAGTTRSTFFRHFRDKRETLFKNHELFAPRYGEAVTEAPAGVRPLEAIATALVSIAPETFTAAGQRFAASRMAVVRSTPELRERELLKAAAITASLTEAFRTRGLDARAAEVAAQLGLLVFVTAYERWAETGAQNEIADIVRRIAGEFSTALTAII